MKRVRSVVVAAVALAAFAACGNPSARTVAEDVIDALPELTDEQRTCLQGKLDGYTNEELDAVAANNPTPSAPTDEFQQFVDDLATCTTSGG